MTSTATAPWVSELAQQHLDAAYNLGRWLLGNDHDAADAVHDAYVRAGVHGEVARFIDDMPGKFSRADLVVCRSGASTVAEITAAGKPAVFVPFPRAADDHQNVNARALERAGAAIVVEESKLEAAYLVDTITALLVDQARLERMSQAARSLSHPQAVEDIARLVHQLVEDRVRIL